MEIKILIPWLLLLSVVRGQSTVFKSYDWRTTGKLQDWPKLTSLIPYKGVTESYPVDNSRQYPDNSAPYHDDSYSAEYDRPYSNSGHSVSSYENYGYAPDDTFNMTFARIGGFAGTGDTRGFGAYDFPQNLQQGHHQPPESQNIEYSDMDPEFKELMKMAHEFNNRQHDSMFIHPLPPPL